MFVVETNKSDKCSNACFIELSNNDNIRQFNIQTGITNLSFAIMLRAFSLTQGE